MANATYEIIEFRCIVYPDVTELYIGTTPSSDGMIGVGGWYKKTIGKDTPSIPTLQDALVSGKFLVDWDRGAPPERGDARYTEAYTGRKR